MIDASNPSTWECCPICGNLFSKIEHIFKKDSTEPEELLSIKFRCGSKWKSGKGFKQMGKCKKGYVFDEYRHWNIFNKWSTK